MTIHRIVSSLEHRTAQIVSRTPTHVIRAFLSAPSGITSLAMLTTVVLLAVIAPILLDNQASAINVADGSQGPTALHVLGTDPLGRDTFDRTLVATRLSLSLAVLAAALSVSIGVTFGAGIALFGSRTRLIGARMIDALLGFPSILPAIFIATIIGPSALAAIVGIGVSFAPQFARLVNTLAASIAAKDYVASARIIGISRPRLLINHILPNVAEPVVIVMFVSIGESIIAVSALSFLGLGVQPPQYDWGQMLTQGLQTLYLTPVAAITPAVMIVATGVACGLFGEAVARATNPLLWATITSRKPLQTQIKGRRSVPTNVTSPIVTTFHADALLQVEGLRVVFGSDDFEIKPVADVSFEIFRGDMVGIVGESGSGKSLTALALAQLVPYPGKVTATTLRFLGQNMLLRSTQAERLLANELALVFQDPTSSFNPTIRIGSQLTEASRIHRRARRSAARLQAVARLTEVGIAAAERRLRQYPHELSGGMRQRAMIAMALMLRPALIVADEPTTSLDVTIQAQIVDLLRKLNREYGTAIIMISHDLALISETCHRALVMYGGRIVEDVPTSQLHDAAHPYTKALMASLPSMSADRDQNLTTIPGMPPNPAAMPRGCPFSPRCPLAVELCESMPPLSARSSNHRVACWRAGEPLPS